MYFLLNSMIKCEYPLFVTEKEKTTKYFFFF